MNSELPKNGAIPPSTATATASLRETTRIRAAVMQASDMKIQSRPWVIPSPKVSGSGLPIANALMSRLR